MRNRQWGLAALAVAGFVGLSRADEPNQALADKVAQGVQESGRIRGFDLDIEAASGVVTVTGHVRSQSQRDALVDIIRSQPGVIAVRDRVTVGDSAMQPVAEFQEEKPVPALPGPAAPATEGANNVAPVVEPQPIVDFQGGVAPFSDAPMIPPYSWPAYSPYNNFASMAYQTQYPAGAWPFIGPPYPYPMIPSGWRRVTLTWKKGYWWMRFNAH